MTDAICEIQWIDSDGNPTPDSNVAIGRVRVRPYSVDLFTIPGPSYFAGPRWYNICADHTAHLKDPKMCFWEFEALLVTPDQGED